MAADVHFEERTRAILETLVAGSSPLQIEAAVTALDVLRSECQQRRLIALAKSFVRIAVQASGEEISEEEFAAISEMSLRQAVMEVSECNDGSARLIALQIVAGLNADLGGVWTVDSRLKEFVA